MSSARLGFEEQSLLSLVIMVSFIVWVVGAIYFGVAADQWLMLRTEYQSIQK
jgi:hypothetical protein